MPGGKQKTKKPNQNLAESDNDSEHELSYYANDRIRLMKEVLKLIKPKKIKSIAPDFMKNLDVDEINSILLEELLGISNKRLKHILNGDNVEAVSTSSESEAEQKPIDVISLDDISDTDDEFGLGNLHNNIQNDNKDVKTKSKHKEKKLKVMKKEKGQTSKISEPQLPETEQNKLMNVLEILELQARARAIRSQLALESMNKKPEDTKEPNPIVEDDDDTAVIVNSPQNEEIIITSSDSEEDNSNKTHMQCTEESMVKMNVTGKNNTDNLKNQNAITDTTELNANKKETDESTSMHNRIPNDELLKEKCNDGIENDKLSNDPTIKANKSCRAVRNDSSYKSDSDNDIINLDSEDIINV